MPGFIELMESRGMLAQITHPEEFAEHLASGAQTAYIGFDPTAESLHIGNLLPIMALRRWQQCGHRVIALVGGATAMIGDPTGKTEMRQMMTPEVIAQRTARVKQQLSQLLDMDDPAKGVVLNNADWLAELEYIPFLREIGPHFSINRMLTAECFKSRLEKGLSFLEFNYMIMQSFDFYHLNQSHGCTVQMGGDDQWSNILGGMDLIRRKTQGKAFCLTVPLLVDGQGKKMGKTEKGAIWLDGEMTSPYELYQYFRNIDDSVVEKCLKYYTELPVTEVAGLTAPEADINQAKSRLGYEVCVLLHGQEAAEKALETATKLFASGGAGGEDAPEVWVAAADLPETEVRVVELLAVGQIAPSRSEARRWVKQGGLSLDGAKVSDEMLAVPVQRLLEPNGVLIKKGKKHYYRVRLKV